MSQALIEKLDAPTRSKLRSTQILTSLPQIISEFVQNSLDANASYIDIGVNCEEWMCWVKDNGSGISKDSLSLLGLGSEEGRYESSKTYDSGLMNTFSTFGFRGEALVSAADLACLEISSRTVNSRETWSIILKGGKNLYSGPAVRWQREAAGTVVCVRDAFYNLPVRRLSHPPPSRTLELIRKELETYALVFPRVAFTLENMHNNGETSTSRGHVVRIPKTLSSLASFRNLYGRALAEHVEEIELHSGNLKLDGFISLNGAHSRGYQFLYVNRHPISHCDLHHLIDSAFASSSFMKNALDEAGETKLPRSNVRRSPRKTEKKPVYVLNLTVPPRYVDKCLEPAKSHVQFQNKTSIMALLSSCVQSFLNRHGFTTHGPNPQHLETHSSSPRKRRKITVADDSGYGECTVTVQSTGESLEKGPAFVDDSGYGEQLYADRAISNNTVEVNKPIQYPLLTSGNEETGEISWTDPNTGETFIVDSRTGNSRPQAEPPPWQRDTESGNRSRRTIPCERNVVHGNEATNMDKGDAPAWLQQALQANEVYEMHERAVPTLKPSSAFQPDVQELSRHFQHSFTGATLTSVSRRFEKIDLRQARVINQVDKKFIACILENRRDTKDGPFLPSQLHQEDTIDPVVVLIDQHAADERVRVERFLKDLCLGFLHNRDKDDDMMDGIQLRKLSPLLPLLLTQHEAQRLKDSVQIQRAFRHWGFSFSNLSRVNIQDPISHSDNGAGYTQVMVESIPEVVSDKLLLGNELRDLIKGFLGQLETEILPASTVTLLSSDDIDNWIKALRWCPQGLLELINSKACRGAIMFNDVLSMSQCERLVQELSETAFPFQCAHGRPSLVPLTDVGALCKKRRAPCDFTSLIR